MHQTFGRIVKRIGAHDGANFVVRVGFDKVYPLSVGLHNLAEIWFREAMQAEPRKDPYRSGAGVYVSFEDTGGQRVVADLRLAN